VGVLFSLSRVFSAASNNLVFELSRFNLMILTFPCLTFTGYSLIIMPSFSKIKRLRFNSLYVLPTLLTSFITCSSRFSERTFKIFCLRDEASTLLRSNQTPSLKLVFRRLFRADPALTCVYQSVVT
jgi:hypothetical protein